MEANPNPRFRPELRAKGHDPDWGSFFEEHCESPAEVDFLRAMITRFDLLPELGSLRGGGVKLDLQVGEGRYRTDFLANNWLVVEIDGAAYHSSPEAIANDQARDQYFESLGYSVVRIPAKIVFRDPEEAVRRFEAALALGKRPPVEIEQKSGFARLGDTMAGINKFMGDVNDHVSRSRAINAAMNDSKVAFSAEKAAVNMAIASAKSQLKVSGYLGGCPEKKAHFDQYVAELNVKFAEYDATSPPDTAVSFPVLRIVAPEDHPDIEIDRAIKHSFQNLLAERRSFMEVSRATIATDARLAAQVESKLIELGYGDRWQELR